MVENVIETEVKKALECVENYNDFILTGGAGSGKTYSLISLIREVTIKYPEKNIVCITYTNNAVSEIKKRFSTDNLIVSTIHEYIWQVIKTFQNELKDTLIELIKEKHKRFKLPEGTTSNELTSDFFVRSIKYDEFYRLSNNIESSISHDQVLILAERMFSKYIKLQDILIDSADLILIDEYQDTSELVVKIMLEHLKKSNKRNLIGFFGDSMQAIYDDGIGEIKNYELIKINKIQNRRNPLEVINFANQFRDDGIIQVPSNDEKAPNMKKGKVIEGSVKFIYGDTLDLLERLKNTQIFSSWNFNSGKTTKELRLVHRVNAEAAGFEGLYGLYNNDSIIELLTKIKGKIKKGDIVVKDDSTFEEMVIESNITKGKSPNQRALVEIIKENSSLKPYYEDMRHRLWSDIQNQSIYSDSLLAYQFNNSNNAYESTSNRDKILIKLDEIYKVLDLYKKKKYNSLLRILKRPINSLKDKKDLKKDLEFFGELQNKTIGEVIEIGSSKLNIQLDDSFNDFITQKGEYLWNRIRSIPFNEYLRSIEYNSNFLPFATQHSIKGSEFENVLVVLDNYKWNKYNFRAVFDPSDINPSVTARTRKLFYVSITRPLKNLVIYMATDDPIIIKNAEERLGKEHVINGNEYSASF